MFKRKKILFIGGSLNQTTQMHKIAMHLQEHDVYFTPFYVDGMLEYLRRWGLMENTGVGNKLASRSIAYMHTQDLDIDYGGTAHDYDLIVTCSDLYIQQNIRGKRILLVQEGMTDPENLIYHAVKKLKLPRWLASTSTTGLSHAYDYFCVASYGYRDLFTRKGVDPKRIRVTGIPNFDNCAVALDNNFPYKNYVLAATSDMRETFKYENRKAFIQKCLDIADGRQLIFKLHPNEQVERATREIERWAPEALVFPTGNIDQMIANCDVLVTRYSSVVYIGMALHKEVYSDFEINMLRRMTPIQNGGTSASAISGVARRLLDDRPVPDSYEELHASTYTPLSVATGDDFDRILSEVRS